jgi:uncharacterized RDD family membrane protein YckC
MNNETDTHTNDATGNATQSPYQSPATTSTTARGAASSIAPLVTRVIAMVIDVVVYMAIFYIPFLVLPAAVRNLSFLPALGYFLLRDGLPFLDGQSIGKKAMGIRAVTSDGRSLSGNWGPAIIRNAVFMIPCFAIVELIVLITRQGKSQEGLRLGDDWAKTKVIMAPKA